jgi:hypothetical protein
VKTKVVHDNIVTVKHIFTPKPDGTKIVEVDSVKDNSTTSLSKDLSKTDAISKTSITDIKYQSDYSVTLLQPFTLSQALSGTPDYSQAEIIGGVRLFGSPVFLNIGTTPMFNKIFIGATVEF